jgi:S1-C subfamily serine protease
MGERIMPKSPSWRILFGMALATWLGACSTSPQPLLESLHYSTVMVEHAQGHGTGIIVGPDLVLTADHVISDEPLEVLFFEGQHLPGVITWRDPQLDLALVETRIPEGYPTPSWFCGDLEPGQHLVLIGHPTHSRWVAVGGHLPGVAPFDGELVALGFPIGLGTSGGPVFDEAGRVVGVALAILAERSSASANFGDFKDTGIGLMLPAKVFCSAEGLVELAHQRQIDPAQGEHRSHIIEVRGP